MHIVNRNERSRLRQAFKLKPNSTLKNKLSVGVKAFVVGAVGVVATFAGVLVASAQSVASGTFNTTDTINVIAPAAQAFHDTFILIMEWLIPITIVVALIIFAVRWFQGMAHGRR